MDRRRRVLVTRPREAAEKTARRIAALGHEPVILPLSRIVAIACDLPGPLVRFDAVAVTSANAIRHAGRGLIDRLAGLPCIAVGEATARAVEKAGFSAVTSVKGDVSDIVARMAGTLPGGARIAYPCGRVRRPDLEAAARRHGFRIVAMETYDTEKVSYSTQEMAGVLGSKPIDDALVFSANGAAAMQTLPAGEYMNQIFENTRFLCISERVADTIATRGGQSVAVADRPNEDAMLALL
ncbi:uroporphyrinogen-III synthase [Zhengella sp. ZM62]|uniref:uroporphyrinogen-III synthase n=1 Tax=Zhengella sedimenti TaxID=3390035 RepID=UPI003975C20A